MMTLISEERAYEQYNSMLDEFYPVSIGGIEFSASRVLKSLDPTCYSIGFDDWLDNEDLQLDDEDLQSE